MAQLLYSKLSTLNLFSFCATFYSVPSRDILQSIVERPPSGTVIAYCTMLIDMFLALLWVQKYHFVPRSKQTATLKK